MSLFIKSDLKRSNPDKARHVSATMRVIVMLSLLFVAACGGGTPSPTRPQQPKSRPAQAQEQQRQVFETEQQALEGAAQQQASADAVVIGFMVPLSGPDAPAGTAMLRAATMALFDAYDPRIKLLPFDTASDPEIAQIRANEAINAGASIVLGPLLSENLQAVGPLFKAAGVPVVSFSNDRQAASPTQLIMGFLPEAEVKRVADFAILNGFYEFGALIPEGEYGERVQNALGDALVDAGGGIIAQEVYPPEADALFEPVKRLARYDERRRDLRDEVRFLRSLRDDVTDEIAKALEEQEVIESVPFDAIMVPEGGALMRTLAPLLPFYEIDPNIVKLIGTGLWNNPGLLGEPPMQGAWFAAPEPAAPNAFLQRYERQYGEEAPRIATIAYDAAALVAALARGDDTTGTSDDEEDEQDAAINPRQRPLAEQGVRDSRFAYDRLMRAEGFVGLDGLFRFLPDGTNERALAILEINAKGFKIAEPAPENFPAFGYSLNR